MFEIRFPLRLQNVREQEMRGGSIDLFTLCKVYLVLVPHSVQINSIIKLEGSSSGFMRLFHKIICIQLGQFYQWHNYHGGR